MKNIILILCVFLFSEVAFAKIEIEQLPEPGYMNSDGSTYYGAPSATNVTPSKNNGKTKTYTTTQVYDLIDKQALANLERKVYGRDFSAENELNRLYRLESRVFGAVQSGDGANRLNNLMVAVSGNQQYQQQQQSAYLPGTSTGKGLLRKVFDTINNGGSLTGFSPSVTTYDPYQQQYQQNNYYQNPYSSQYPNQYAGNAYQPQQQQYPQFTTPNYPTQYYNNNPKAGYRQMFAQGPNTFDQQDANGEYIKRHSAADGGIGVTILN